MEWLKDALWVSLNAFASVLTMAQHGLEAYAARKCREYIASLADEG
jgi:hypothetical protein